MGTRLRQQLTKLAVFCFKWLVCHLISGHLLDQGYIWGALFFTVASLVYAWKGGGAMHEVVVAWIEDEEDEDA